MSQSDVRRIVLAGVNWLLIVSAAAPALAQTTFTNRAAWAAAVGSHVTIDFEGIAPDGGLTQFPDGLTLSGVTFLGAGSLDVYPTGWLSSIRLLRRTYPSGIRATWRLPACGFGTAGASQGSITLPGRCERGRLQLRALHAP